LQTMVTQVLASAPQTGPSASARGCRCRGKLLRPRRLPSALPGEWTRALWKRQPQRSIRLENLLVSPKPEQIGIDFGVRGLILILPNISGRLIVVESTRYGSPVAIFLQPFTQPIKTARL